MSFLNGKKIKELQSENDELKKILEGISEKENQLKHFDELIKKARFEYSEIVAKKDQTVQKLEALEHDKAKFLQELNKISVEIKQLREIKLAEHNQIISLENAINHSDQNLNTSSTNLLKSKQIISNEIETAEKRKNNIALETFNLRKKFDELNRNITDGKKVLGRLNSDIEKKKDELSSLIDRQRLFSKPENESFYSINVDPNTEEIQNRISTLTLQENKLIERINIREKQLEDLEKEILGREHNHNIQSPEIYSLDNLSHTESAKRETVLELGIKIDALEAQLTSIAEEIRSKSGIIDELQTENKRLVDQIKLGRNEFSKLNQSIEIETIRLTDLDYSLTILENEFDKLKNDISSQMSLKETIELQISKRTEEKINLEDLLKELKETTTILAQLKHDIEKGTGQSAKRFTGVLQYYSSIINDIYKRKSNAEKSLAQSEKELAEKQRLIDERQTTLLEMENILYVRYDRIGIIKDLARVIADQRKFLESSNFISEDSNQKEEHLFDREISHQKLIEYENALKEILNSSDRYAADLINKRSSLEKEIIVNKNRLNELNQNIRHSTGELTEIKNSISKIKIEHEDHRVSINKLASVKMKLEEQINSYKMVVEKYAKIKDKIREEQELIKSKRKLASEINSSKKTVDAQNTKWIKI